MKKYRSNRHNQSINTAKPTQHISVSIKALIIGAKSSANNLIKKILNKPGSTVFSIMETPSLATACALIQQNSFDIVLINLEIRELKQASTLPLIEEISHLLPAIIIADSENEELALISIQHGAQNFIPRNELNYHLLLRTIRYSIERKNIRVALERVNRSLKTLSECNQILIRCKIETKLLQEICNTIVNEGGYQMAWIGYINTKNKTLVPVVHAGHEDGYLTDVVIKYDASVYGQGPTGQAIRSKKTYICHNINTDPNYEPWREKAQQRNYASLVALPLKVQDKIIGTLNIYTDKPNIFDDEEIKLLTELAADLSFGISSLQIKQDKNSLTGQLDAKYAQLKRVFEQVVDSLASVMNKRDPYTAGHQRRVTQLSCAIARELRLSESKIESIRIAGILHDIGKISVPAEILSKPLALTKPEYKIVMTHAQSAYDIVKDIEFPWPIAEIILQHHERLDGSGYPRGLTEKDILLEAKILTVADVVEAMFSHRPYRPAPGIEKALSEIEANKGRLYDPKVVNACIYLFKEKGFNFDEGGNE